MTMIFSTGLRTAIAKDTGMKAAMANGCIEIRSGPPPASADAAPIGTLLGLVTLASGAFSPGTATNGINFDDPTGTGASVVLAKAAAETWSFVGIADGIAGWFRHRANAADSGASSTTLKRIDGLCAVAGGNLLMSTTTIVTGAPVTVDAYSFTFPSIARASL